MARAVGRDVMVRLSGEVAALREEMKTPRTHTRIMSSGMGSVLTSLRAMREDMGAMQVNMDVMRANMDSFRANTEVMVPHVESMVGELRGLSGGLQRMETHVGRMARLLGSLADTTSACFEQVEKRLDALEDDEKN